MAQCGPGNLSYLPFQGIWNCDSLIIAFAQDMNKMSALKLGAIEQSPSTHQSAEKEKSSKWHRK